MKKILLGLLLIINSCYSFTNVNSISLIKKHNFITNTNNLYKFKNDFKTINNKLKKNNDDNDNDDDNYINCNDYIIIYFTNFDLLIYITLLLIIINNPY